MERKKVCEKCGEEFVRTSNAQKYCKKCRTKKLKKLKRKCAVCGEAFEITGSYGRGQKYCSAKCRYKANNQVKIHKRQYSCKWCGVSLPEDSTEKYCSEACERKATSDVTKKRGRRKKALSIDEVCKLAKAEGLTYGEYVVKYGGNA